MVDMVSGYGPPNQGPGQPFDPFDDLGEDDDDNQDNGQNAPRRRDEDEEPEVPEDEGAAEGEGEDGGAEEGAAEEGEPALGEPIEGGPEEAVAGGEGVEAGVEGAAAAGEAVEGAAAAGEAVEGAAAAVEAGSAIATAVAGGSVILTIIVIILVVIVIGAAISFFISSSGGGGSQSPTPSGDISAYQNPLRSIPDLSPARIDEGVDYVGNGPYYAIGDGKISFASSSTGWPGGNYLSYTLTDGPAAGKTIYIAENCTGVSRFSPGEQVTSSTVLCQMHSFYPFIETGWSQAGNDLPMSHDVYTTVPDGSATSFGVNFSDLLRALNAPGGTYQFPSQRGHPVGTLPAGWPTWGAIPGL